MRAEIGIAADVPFIDDALAAINNEENSDLEPVEPWDLVEWQEQEPGYAGYRERLRDFVAGKTAEWHERFGGPTTG